MSDDNLTYGFSYSCSDVFHVRSFIERLEEEYSIQLTNSFLVFQNDSEQLSGSLGRARPRDVFSFSVMKISGNDDMPSPIFENICTMEIRDYDPENKENCTVVLTGTDEENERFLKILISVYPSSDLMIKEPAN